MAGQRNHGNKITFQERSQQHPFQKLMSYPTCVATSVHINSLSTPNKQLWKTFSAQDLYRICPEQMDASLALPGWLHGSSLKQERIYYWFFPLLISFSLEANCECHTSSISHNIQAMCRLFCWKKAIVQMARYSVPKMDTSDPKYSQVWIL